MKLRIYPCGLYGAVRVRHVTVKAEYVALGLHELEAAPCISYCIRYDCDCYLDYVLIFVKDISKLDKFRGKPDRTFVTGELRVPEQFFGRTNEVVSKYCTTGSDGLDPRITIRDKDE